MDPARGPARRVTGTQGRGRGVWNRREPPRTTGTGRRALGGGKGGSRVFGQHLLGRGGRRRGGGQTAEAEGLEGGHIRHSRHGRSQGCRTLGMGRGHGRRGGRGVTGHGNRANSEDRGDRSRGGGHRGGSTANHSSTHGSTPTSRRGRLKRRIQPRADLLAESLPLETGQGRGRQVEDLKHIGKEHPLQSPHGAELRGQECCSTLDKVGVERGSELDPIDVTVGAMLGRDDIGSKVGPIEEPLGMEDGNEVKDREVIGGCERRCLGRWDIRGGSTSWSGHHYVKKR